MINKLKNFMIKFNNFIVTFGREKIILIFLIGCIVANFSTLGILPTAFILLMYVVIGGLLLLSNIEFKFFDKKTYLLSIACGFLSGLVSLI